MPKTILIVDDDEIVRKLYARMFSTENMFFALVGSIAEAKRLMAANRYDLLITDLILGDGSGTQLLEEANKTDYETHAILVSGSIEAHEMQLFTETYNLKGCFRKPFNVPALLTTVNELLA